MNIMNIPSLHEEKKVDDQVLHDNCRIERLERLVEILCNDLFHVKEQQLRSQKQMLDLQSDLAAAELARQDAERQMEQLHLKDHKVLLSLVEKQQQFEEDSQNSSKISHVRTYSTSRVTKRQNIDLIDVTSYEESTNDCESMHDQVYHLDDIHPEDSSCDQYMLQLWEDLSSSVQQLSSDLIEQRDAFEFVWTKFQLTNNQRITALEDASTKQVDALTGMAAEWDTKLSELSDHVQSSSHEFSNEKTSMTSFKSEMMTNVQQLREQLVQLQSSVQRHMDYNRCKNGEQLVVKREHELQLQKVNEMIQSFTTIIHKHADQICAIQSAATTSCHHCTSRPVTTTTDETVPKPTLAADEKPCIDYHEILDTIETDLTPSEREDDDSFRTSLTWPIQGNDLSSVKVNLDDYYDHQPLSTPTTILQRCQSY